MENKYGKWTVIDNTAKKIGPKMYYLCKCVCGKEKYVYKHHLLSGASTACRRCAILRHGYAKGSFDTLERSTYSSYINMCSRCNNLSKHKSAKCYQSDPVKLCSRWKAGGFEVFLKDMGTKPTLQHSIDRVDNNNREYSPENCRWATKKEQVVNTKRCRKITYDGITATVRQWAAYVGASWTLIDSRLYRGWDVERALFTPKGKKNARV